MRFAHSLNSFHKTNVFCGNATLSRMSTVLLFCHSCGLCVSDLFRYGFVIAPRAVV